MSYSEGILRAFWQTYKLTNSIFYYQVKYVSKTMCEGEKILAAMFLYKFAEVHSKSIHNSCSLCLKKMNS